MLTVSIVSDLVDWHRYLFHSKSGIANRKSLASPTPWELLVVFPVHLPCRLGLMPILLKRAYSEANIVLGHTGCQPEDRFCHRYGVSLSGASR